MRFGFDIKDDTRFGLSVSDDVVFTFGIAEEYSEVTTDENDYIYEVFEDHSETWFYIGSAPRICMPQTLEGKPLTIVHATTFNFTGVTGVKIPEGIIIIE